MVGNCKVFLATQKANLKIAFLSRTDAFLSVFMMLINNSSFLFMWWVIFNSKGSINGWDFNEMALLYAVFNISLMLYAVFVRGVEEIPQYITTGALDGYLTGPKNVLYMIALSKSAFANWGDFITGIVIFFFSSYASLTNFILIIFFSFMAAIVLFSFRLILSTLAFFNDNTMKIGHDIFLAFLTFASQPASIFVGWYKVLILTIVPAGFISLYPISLIKNFSYFDFAIYIAGIGILFTLSIKFFYFALKKYSSGNRFGIR